MEDVNALIRVNAQQDKQGSMTSRDTKASRARFGVNAGAQIAARAVHGGTACRKKTRTALVSVFAGKVSPARATTFCFHVQQEK